MGEHALPRRLGILALVVLEVAMLPPAADSATVEARRGAVAAEHRLASEAGVEMLRRGGNAVDAAAAAALATGVVNPSSSGIGGGGFMVLWDASRGRATTIDFRESAPRRAREDMFVRADGSLDAEGSKTGPLAVGVPGELRGLALALARHGRLSFADVVQPAIRIAREGFAIEAHLAAQIASGRDRLAADPELARVFLHEDGSPRPEGEVLRRPALAATLERLAEVGVEDFYEGEIAVDIVRATSGARGGGHALDAGDAGSGSRERGALDASDNASAASGSGGRGPALDAADLAAYRPIEREPLRIRYRGRTILAMAPPSSGGGVLGEVLGVLGAYDLETIGRDGATWPHLLADTLKAAFADRATWYGDPAFTAVPLTRLLGAKHLDGLRSRLRASRAVPSAEFAPRPAAADDAGTSHISVVDADGNAASLTTSVNTGFGAGLAVPGRDIVLNNTMDDFAAQPGKPNAFGLVGSGANAIAAGKRPLSSMTPVIVLEGGRVRLVAGASGGPLIITSTLQTLVGVIDFGLDARQAVEAPRIHHQWMPEVLMVEEAVPAATKASLKRLGHKVVPLPPRASVQAVQVTGTGAARRLQATSDPRKGGLPAGW
jgi:gamma-glutamyltranspeptidase/glutathione hydrolase